MNRREKEEAIEKSKALERSIKKVRELTMNIERSIWDLGIEIARVHDEELWKARLIDGLYPQFRTWKDFCAAVLQMSHTHAYKLMENAKLFTREQVATIGTTKLTMIVRAPFVHRDRLLHMAERGCSSRELENEVVRLSGRELKVKRLDTETLLGELHSWCEAASQVDELSGIRREITSMLKRRTTSAA